MKKFLLAIVLIMAGSFVSICATGSPQNETDSEIELTNDNILKICKFLVQTPPSNNENDIQVREYANSLVLRFTMDTKEFTLSFGDAMATMLELGKNKPESSELMMVYVAGETIYLLEHHQKESNAESFAAAMEDVLNIYTQMPKQSIKTLNKYLKMDKAERQAEFIKFYNKKTK